MWNSPFRTGSSFPAQSVTGDCTVAIFVWVGRVDIFPLLQRLCADLMALDHLLDLFVHLFLCFSSIFSVLVIPIYGRLKLASSLVKFLAEFKILFID